MSSGAPRLARGWHLLTVAVVLASLVTQIVLLARHSAVPVPTRYVRLLSFFTIQSNLLVAASAATLALDPGREAPGWRVLRLMGLVGITVTGIVYVIVLRPLQELTGADRLADWGFHYATPLLAVLGWLLFGPRPRWSRRDIGLALLWPVAWLAYTLVHGAVTQWYPYPFVDATRHGYAIVALNCLLVTVLMTGVALAYAWADARLPATPVGPLLGAAPPVVDHAAG